MQREFERSKICLFSQFPNQGSKIDHQSFFVFLNLKLSLLGVRSKRLLDQIHQEAYRDVQRSLKSFLSQAYY